MREFINATDLDLAPAWICRRLELFDTTSLRLHLKRHRRKDQFFSGYCRYSDYLTVAAIHEELPVPFRLVRPVGSRKNRRCRRGFEYLWDEMPVVTPDQALVWVAGHECYHYLCKTRQLRGNWETRANRFGFDWLRVFAREHTEQLSFFEKLSASRYVRPSGALRTVYG